MNPNDSTTNLMASTQDDRHEEIALRAYGLWQERGSPIGSPEEDWLRAEQEICNRGAQPPEVAPTSATKARAVAA
jgi:Protein of unknown function (DUF2934)